MKRRDRYRYLYLCLSVSLTLLVCVPGHSIADAAEIVNLRSDPQESIENFFMEIIRTGRHLIETYDVYSQNPLEHISRYEDIQQSKEGDHPQVSEREGPARKAGSFIIKVLFAAFVLWLIALSFITQKFRL